MDKKRLDKLRALGRQGIINSANNTDEQALQVAALYPDWEALKEGATLTAGERYNYEGILYNVLQTHEKQEAWNPADAPSVFAKVLIADPSVIPEWEQPESTNGYGKGDKVTHGGKTWESLTDNNVWEPGAQGTEALWKKVEG